MSKINTAEYSADLKRRFNDSDGKLFLVDYSRSAAFDVLCELHSESGKPSLLLIVKDAELALQYEALLKDKAEGLFSVCDENAIKSLIGEARTPDALRQIAPKIKEKYKSLIVPAFDSRGRAVLNYEICRDDGKSGNFAGNDKASAYTFSDALTEAGYEFIAVDGVFDYIKFTSEDKEYKPGEDEMIDFVGKSFYTDTAHSYRRLNNLVDNGKYALITSDEMTGEDAVSFYAVMELIRADFSLIEVRKKVIKNTIDYSALCDMINSNVLGAAQDPDIVSSCLQRTRGFSNSVPSDVYAMSSFLPRAFEFISLEECALKVLDYLVKHRAGGDFSQVDRVGESFGQDYNEIADCFVEILFKNEFKAEIERNLRKTRVSDMEREEFSSLFAVLLKYGVYHWHTPLQNKPALIRLFREYSGFEYIVRRLGRHEYDGEGVRCVFEKCPERLYKCAEVERLLSDREAELGVKTPMLLVVRDGGERVAQCLNKLLPENKIYTKNYQFDEGAINIIEYNALRVSPMEFNVKSVVYFDVCYDVATMRLMISRLDKYAAPKQVILAAGVSLDGLCADVFEQLLLSDIKALPVVAPSVTVKTGLELPYSEVVENLNIVYKSLQNAVENGTPDIIDDTSASYNHMLAEYTTYSSVPEREINMDIEFIARVGKYFTEIFRNTMSVGESGEEVSWVERKYEPIKKKNEKPKESLTEMAEFDFFFNVCPRVLSHECNIKERNCGGCENYKLHRVNGYKELVDNINLFFKESYSYLEKMERFRTEMQMNATINAGGIDEDDENELDAIHLKEYEKRVRAALDSIDLEGKNTDGFFVIEYEPIEAIREYIYRPYRRMLRKYYKTVMEIMNNASEKAKRELHNALDCTPAVES